MDYLPLWGWWNPQSWAPPNLTQPIQPGWTFGNVITVNEANRAVRRPLSDRYPAKLVAGGGVALAFASALMALALDERSGLACVALALAVQGLGFAFFSSPNMLERNPALFVRTMITSFALLAALSLLALGLSLRGARSAKPAA